MMQDRGRSRAMDSTISGKRYVRSLPPISTNAGLSADLRRQLAETKIEPAAEEPAPPPPVRQAEATPARSTKNKRAQADR